MIYQFSKKKTLNINNKVVKIIFISPKKIEEKDLKIFSNAHALSFYDFSFNNNNL